MLQAIRNALGLPEIRSRILFTLFILVIYRLVSHIPVPGVNLDVLRQIQASVETGGGGGLGALERTAAPTARGATKTACAAVAATQAVCCANWRASCPSLAARP